MNNAPQVEAIFNSLEPISFTYDKVTGMVRSNMTLYQAAVLHWFTKSGYRMIHHFIRNAQIREQGSSDLDPAIDDSENFPNDIASMLETLLVIEHAETVRNNEPEPLFVDVEDIQVPLAPNMLMLGQGTCNNLSRILKRSVAETANMTPLDLQEMGIPNDVIGVIFPDGPTSEGAD